MKQLEEEINDILPRVKESGIGADHWPEDADMEELMNPETKRNPDQEKLYQAINQYSELVRENYEEDLRDDPPDSGEFNLYNGCHGTLTTRQFFLAQETPDNVRLFLRDNPEKTVTFVIHKKTPVCSEVHVGAFTEVEGVYTFDSEPFHRYLKLEFTQKGRDISVYNQDKEIYEKVSKVPNIQFKYNSKDFPMGTFMVIMKGSYFLPYEFNITEPYNDQSSFQFPNIEPKFQYRPDNSGKAATTQLVGDDHAGTTGPSLLETCFEKVVDYSKDSEINLSEEEDLEINIYNSSCLDSDEYLILCQKFKEWAKIMKREILFEIEKDLDTKRQKLRNLKSKKQDEIETLRSTLESLEQDYEKIKEIFGIRSLRPIEYKHPLQKRIKYGIKSAMRKKKNKKQTKKEKKSKKEKKKKQTKKGKKKKQTKKGKKSKKLVRSVGTTTPLSPKPRRLVV